MEPQGRNPNGNGALAAALAALPGLPFSSSSPAGLPPPRTPQKAPPAQGAGSAFWGGSGAAVAPPKRSAEKRGNPQKHAFC
eukprot:7203853-Alexandrium_andersonii.AAC.1